MFKVGIESIDHYMHLFENKKVGLITNPTAITRNFVSTIDILNQKTQLKALFGPEHGVRGDIQAGDYVNDFIDPLTSCKVYSLYGKTRKPTMDMLKDIDVLCFDIQDVGARFYTYIYTMAYAMMAAKEKKIPFVVFDRPNPLGGEIVEGNILNPLFKSFIGYYEIPQRYGLTIGELAMFFNDYFKIGCQLEIVAMQGWKRHMTNYDLRFPWVLPSPNLPTKDSVWAYMATCIFEGTNISEGRGTTKPFQFFGAPWFNSASVLNALKSFDLKGVSFRNVHFIPTFSKHEKKLCHGLEMYVTNHNVFEPIKTAFVLLDVIKNIHDVFSYNPPYQEGGRKMIDLWVGDDFLSEQKLSLDQIIKKINVDSKTFKEMKERYHLYD